MHLLKTLILIARASRIALGAPSKQAFDAAAESIQARDDTRAEEYSAADRETMMDDLVALIVGESKSK